MENAVNTNRQRKKVPVKLQHFFKHENEEIRSFFILYNKLIQMMNSINWFVRIYS